MEHEDFVHQVPVPVSTADAYVKHTYYCNDLTSLPSDSKAIDIRYQYEIVLSHSIDLQDALFEIKKEVIASLTDSLNCTTTSMKRSVLDTAQSTFIGIEGGSDRVDTSKESCSMASFNGCIPIVSHLTGYFDESASDVDIQKATDHIVYTIQQGMSEGRYNSDAIRWIVFTSEDAKSSSLEKVYIIPHDNSSGSIWTPFAYALICSLIIAIAIVSVLLIKESMRKDQVLPRSQSVIEKVQNIQEYSSDESNNDSDGSEDQCSAQMML